MSITKISTAHMSREEWLLRRRRTIGGSDAAGVMGMSPWATPYTVWAEKTGLLQEKPDTEAMRQGRDLEDYVARRFAEASGKTVRRENFMLYHDDYPFAHADIDRWVVGEKSGLECKTTSALNVRSFARRFSGGVLCTVRPLSGRDRRAPLVSRRADFESGIAHLLRDKAAGRPKAELVRKCHPYRPAPDRCSDDAGAGAVGAGAERRSARLRRCGRNHGSTGPDLS